MGSARRRCCARPWGGQEHASSRTVPWESAEDLEWTIRLNPRGRPDRAAGDFTLGSDLTFRSGISSESVRVRNCSATEDRTVLLSLWPPDQGRETTGPTQT